MASVKVVINVDCRIFGETAISGIYLVRAISSCDEEEFMNAAKCRLITIS